MSVAPVSGTEGYAKEVDDLFARYESIPFEDVHKSVFHLIPKVPSRVLDIGAGTGRDAAGLAAMGHRVVAVEPTDAMRERAMKLHPSPQIEWVNDSLPGLTRLRARSEVFDIVFLSAVWMHLDVQQRKAAMPNVASLVRKGGTMILTLRHGPVPKGRRMFQVSADETIVLARLQEFDVILKLEGESVIQRRDGVTWTRLAFAKR